ncbi:MAG: transcription antitermination factor NusB [Holosporales bacterium]|jgi:N utilization substance protein B|nr:transcription antitermination factor NusB [Holosporales bacterium]
MDKNGTSNAQTGTPYTIKGTPRHASRIVALQVLYQLDQTGATAETVLRQFDEEIVGSTLEREDESNNGPNNCKWKHVNVEFIKQLVHGVVESRRALNEHIRKHVLENFDRLPILLHEILELATFEMLYIGTPPPVAINEYVEISKDFFNEEEHAFVNGVLDSVGKNVVSTEKRAAPSQS